MNGKLFLITKVRTRLLIFPIALGLLFPQTVLLQTNPTKGAAVASGKVTKIDINGLKPLLKPNGKPLLINFWATWCDPCRDEFPDLVSIDKAYRGKIDFLTVSLDDIGDIDSEVPKFLRQMKAEMPAFLLSTPDESAAISLVSKDWAGNLPLTILFGEDGRVAYQRNGKIRYFTLTAELDKLLAKPDGIK